MDGRGPAGPSGREERARRRSFDPQRNPAADRPDETGAAAADPTRSAGSRSGKKKNDGSGNQDIHTYILVILIKNKPIEPLHKGNFLLSCRKN